MNLEKKIICIVLFIVTALCLFLFQGAVYGSLVLGSLFAAEAARYFVAKKYQSDYTLPYFIPMPTIFGSMGTASSSAVLAPSKKALFDLGLAHLLVTFILGFLFLIVGLKFSHFELFSSEGVRFILYKPLLVNALSSIILGATPPNHEVIFHPIALAGYALIFFTLCAALPIAQLSGGKIFSALLGKKSYILNFSAMAVLVYMGLASHPFWLFLLVITLLIAVKHPQFVTNESDTLGTQRIAAVIILYALLFTCFVPIPFELKIQ